MVGYYFVRCPEDANQQQLMFALHKGTLTASVLSLCFSAFIIEILFDVAGGMASVTMVEMYKVDGWNIFGCIIIGLLCGVFIGQATEYCTSYAYYPVKSITDAGKTEPDRMVCHCEHGKLQGRN
jgi:Na+/H+-translocating membrane pyrophosphatase